MISPYMYVLVNYNDAIMSTMASQITSLTIVYWTVYSGSVQRKLQSSASLGLVWGIHRWPVNSPHKWPVTRRMFPFDDVIMHTVDRPHTPSKNLHQTAPYHILGAFGLFCMIMVTIYNIPKSKHDLGVTKLSREFWQRFTRILTCWVQWLPQSVISLSGAETGIFIQN